MFEKLLANLPYNPNLTKQIGFYARRMRHEQNIRRTGVVFIVLAFMVQFFAFMSPPQSTTAYSSSDMINGGISTKEDAVRACRNNIKNFKDVLWNFGIDCQDISRTHVTSVRSTDNNERLYSLSWLPYGQKNPRSGKPTDETAYNLTKVSETIYARQLRSADTIPFSTYKVLKGNTASGKTFYILFDCGNLMFVGTPKPVKLCPYNSQLPANSSRCVESCPVKGLGDQPKTSPRCVAPCPYNKDIPGNSAQCFIPCKYDKNIPVTSSACRPCEDALSSENAIACVVQRKSAANVTQNVTNADNTTAQPNDVIEYTLYAENRGKDTVKAFVMQENLSDVLDYADIVDLNDGTLDNTTKIVSWRARDIVASSTLTHKVTVRVKSTIPMNTPPQSDPARFDHIMTNVYGNAINIQLPTPDAEPIVTASETLPNAGPGESLLLAGAIVVVAGYFFARSRLLVHESVVVLQETSGGRL